jgi:hypothetical protein
MGKAQIEYGLACDAGGRPVAEEVFAGNTADPSAFISAAATVKQRFELKDVVMVGDRGVITAARIDALKEVGGFGWLASLRAPSIADLAASGDLQGELFRQGELRRDHPIPTTRRAPGGMQEPRPRNRKST